MLSRFFKPKSSSSLVLWTNSFEFLDLYLFIHFGWLIDKIFFQGWNPLTIQVFVWSNIYFIAPICSLLFAWAGDIFGRKPILINSALAMAIVSILIVVLPVETFPYGSAIVLLLIRCVQGCLLGGEPMAASLYMIENFKDVRLATFYDCLAKTTEGIGSVLALSLGLLILHFFGEAGWRLLFFCLFLFLLFIFFVRKHLNETKEYKEYLTNAQIQLWEKEKIREIFIFSSKEVYWNNLIAGFLRWLGYPACFIVTYFHVTPYICKLMGWQEQGMILYNLAVIIGEHGCSTAIYAAVIFLTRWNVRVVGFLCNLIGVSLFLWCLLNLNVLSVPVIFTCQVAFMALVNYCWIGPEIYKTFSVIGRFTNMARTWALARLVNFFICIFALNAAIATYGLSYGCFLILFIINVISGLAFFIMKPYSELKGQ